MKTLLFSVIIISVLLLLLCQEVNGKFCSMESECDIDQCCLKYGFIGWCSDKVNEVGKNCGGRFRCGCIDGLRCVPFREKSFKNTFKIGIGNCYLDR